VIEDWTERQQTAITYMGEHVVRETFSIDAYPLYPNTSLVTALQDRVTPENLVEASDYGIPELQGFVAASRTMQAESTHKSLPDVIGRGNVVIEATTGAIRLVDPIVLNGKDPAEQGLYKRASRILGLDD